MSRKSTAVSKTFADRLNDLIADAKTEDHLQIRDLAREIGIGAGSLSQYQNDVATPSIDALYKIAKYFGVSADWLIGLTNARTSSGDVRKVCDSTGLDSESIECLVNMKTLSQNHQIISTLNYLIQHGTLLKNLHQYFATVFEESLKEKPFSYIGGDGKLRDKRLLLIDIYTSLEKDREKFYCDNLGNKDIKKQMIFLLASLSLQDSDEEDMYQVLYNYFHDTDKDNYSDDMIRTYIEFVKFIGQENFLNQLEK